MNQHTQEPWHVQNDTFIASETIGLAGCLTGRGIDGEANARRIVACVNACAGIATHELELMVGALSIHNQITNTLQEKLTPKATEYRMQRDELLKELQYARSNGIFSTFVVGEIDAAIAKAKEGAA